MVRRRSRKRGSRGIGKLSPYHLWLLIVAQDAICFYCPDPFDQTTPNQNMTIDHVVPLSLGGSHGYLNLVLAHRSCNCYKQSRPPTQDELDRAAAIHQQIEGLRLLPPLEIHHRITALYQKYENHNLGFKPKGKKNKTPGQPYQFLGGNRERMKSSKEDSYKCHDCKGFWYAENFCPSCGKPGVQNLHGAKRKHMHLDSQIAA